MISRVFYSSCSCDIIGSYRYWKNDEHDPTEVSITFSGQILDFCKEINAHAYFVSTHPRSEIFADGQFIMEHRPLPLEKGARFHLRAVTYGMGLLATALRFRAQVAIMDSGTTHFFFLTLFRIFGIRVVPVLHTTLWPHGFPPVKLTHRLVRTLDSWFWRWVPTCVIGVSPECVRQVYQLVGRVTYPVVEIRAQFNPEYFARIPPPPPHDLRPFRMMYIGRIDRIKGVFDILEMAREIEDKHPELVRWEVCGRGKDFEEFKKRHMELGLGDVVNIRGWTSLDDLVNVYGKCHASIVPTRSSFSEGLAMTAAEAILAGRPVVTNPVVPALEILRNACIEAKTNDVKSHTKGVIKLATDANAYNQARSACDMYQSQFYDRNFGLTVVLKRALAGDA